ncbi:MAG TPA: hypothetical protein VFW19_10670 [Allosphingosinicella sp.]|nr:hypothetical protein [Allosphingosinicella sp.]
MSALQSPLGRYAHLNHEPDPRDGFEAARRAWWNEGIALLRPEWLTEWDRAQLEILANKYLGERRTEG